MLLDVDEPKAAEPNPLDSIPVSPLAYVKKGFEEPLSESPQFEGLIGRSPIMLEVFDKIRKVSKRDITVMLIGETGTGKEVIARIIHQASKRASGPFHAVNCAAIPDNLFESELFGHEKGAFTGAIRSRRGVFEKAHKGTLLLDEIVEMHQGSQARILRVLQERKLERLGGSNTIDVDVRVISASNCNIEQATASGLFRMDLYYRLMVYPIYIPPLRERKEDIPLLCEHFIKKYVGPHQEKVSISPEAFEYLMEHNWPGNVRELENVIQFALVSTEGKNIDLENLPNLQKMGKSPVSVFTPTPLRVVEPSVPVATFARNQQREAAGGSMEDMEKQVIQQALREAQGNISAAARSLGLGRTTMYRKMSAFGMHISDDKPIEGHVEAFA